MSLFSLLLGHGVDFLLVAFVRVQACAEHDKDQGKDAYHEPAEFFTLLAELVKHFVWLLLWIHDFVPYTR